MSKTKEISFEEKKNSKKENSQNNAHKKQLV